MLKHWLLERLADFNNRIAIIINDRPTSYNQLLEIKKSWQIFIQKAKVSAGEVVAIDSDYSPDSIALLLALIANKNIIVPLSPSIKQQKDSFMEIAKVDYIIRPNTGKEVIQPFLISSESYELYEKLRQQDAPGLVLFSSGSTGKSKASVFNFNRLLNKLKKEGKVMSTVCFLMFDHIGGINTLFSTIANGGTLVLVTNRFPESVCSLIEKYQLQLLPTSPTFLKMLLISRAYEKYNLSSLSLITYGTEPMPDSTLKELHKHLPKCRLKQTYGLSELGILSTQSENNDSLWMKIGGEGYKLKVIDGVLWIKSETSMLGYLNAPSPFDEEGWMNTHDKVEVDGEYLKILGRETDIINVGGEKVYAAEIESVILEIPNIKDVAVYGKTNPLTGQVVYAKIAVIEEENIKSLRRKIKKHCQTRLAAYKVPAYIELCHTTFHSTRFKKQKKQW